MASNSSKFSLSIFPVNTFPMKATISLSKFCLSKFLTCSIRQILSDFSTIKVLCYMVFKYKAAIVMYHWDIKGIKLQNMQMCSYIVE